MRAVLQGALVAGLFLLAIADAAAQRGQSRDWGDRGSVPTWELESHYEDDVFTFVRIRYSSYRSNGWGGRSWNTDWPNADLNFSYRLKELTSLEVHPKGKIMELTDRGLSNYPFIYIVEPGSLHFMDDEVKALRNYLLNGGFLMVDDFWGEDEWSNFYREIKRVFPDREPKEIPLEHPIFRIVFPLSEKPQVPSPSYLNYGYERPDAKEVHYKGIFDDQGRMMSIICHNTDLGDGWEEEARNPEYFHRFSEKLAYPMGINIIMYALTH